jgi:AAA domain
LQRNDATTQRHHKEDPAMSLDTISLSQQAACPAISQASVTASATVADLLGRVVPARDLDKQPLTVPTWLWHGYLGPGKITLLTSQWKSGKTTLVSLLLARLPQGGQLAGLAVAPAKAFVIS